MVCHQPNCVPIFLFHDYPSIFFKMHRYHEAIHQFFLKNNPWIVMGSGRQCYLLGYIKHISITFPLNKTSNWGLISWVLCGILSKFLTISRGRAVAARQAHNLKAVGSSPTPATNFLVQWLVFYGFSRNFLVHFIICDSPRRFTA